jgi:hypothetical protein
MVFGRCKQRKVIRHKDAEGKANFMNSSYFGVV